jgi:hypothetical protein
MAGGAKLNNEPLKCALAQPRKNSFLSHKKQI